MTDHYHKLPRAEDMPDGHDFELTGMPGYEDTPEYAAKMREAEVEASKVVELPVAKRNNSDSAITVSMNQALTAPVMITEREFNLLKEFGVDLEMDTRSHIDQAVEDSNRSVDLMLKAGSHLMVAQAKCEADGRTFISFLDNCGIAKQRAHEMISFFKFFSSLTVAERDKVRPLPRTKQYLLANADTEIIEELLKDDKKFDRTASLSAASFRKRIRRLEKDKELLHEDVRKHKQKASSLMKHNYGEDSNYLYPDFVAEIRQESHKLSEKGLLCVADLEQLYGDHCKRYEDRAEQRMKEFWATGMVALYYNIQHLALQAGQLLDRMNREQPEAITGGFNGQEMYALADIVRAANDRKLLIQEHELERQRRESDRPRGRGRPKGAKGKK